jgi:hypothetical protein
MPQKVTSDGWKGCYLTGNSRGKETADGKQGHNFYFVRDQYTYRLEDVSVRDGSEHLLQLPKFAPVYLLLGNTTPRDGVTYVKNKMFYVPPKEFLEINYLKTLETVYGKVHRPFFTHDLYSPAKGREHAKLPRIKGRIAYDTTKGRSIRMIAPTMVETTSPNTGEKGRELKWIAIGDITFEEEVDYELCTGNDRSVRAGDTVDFNVAFRSNKMVPNDVTLVALLNEMGRERYSNKLLTPISLEGWPEKVLPMVDSVKTLQDKHWDVLFQHTAQITSPSIILSDNCLFHQGRSSLEVLNLSDFIAICLNNKQRGHSVSFDALFSSEVDEETYVSVLVETNDTTQQLVLDLIHECLLNEATSVITRTRRFTVDRVYVTASLGKMVTESNFVEIGGNPLLIKETNPFLEDVVFLKGDTYSQAYSSYRGPHSDWQVYNQKYCTDPTTKVMLVLGTYNCAKSGKQERYTVLETSREGMEEIADLGRPDRFKIPFKSPTSTTNQQIRTYLIKEKKMTVVQDTTPMVRGTARETVISSGVFDASALSQEDIEQTVEKITKYGEFSMMSMEDLQGRNPSKTYFAVTTRYNSNYIQGKQVFSEIASNSSGLYANFYMVPGTKDKYWVAINGKVSQEKLVEWMKSANKVLANNSSNELNSFATIHINQQIVTLIAGHGDKRTGPQHQHSYRNEAYIHISGLPCVIVDEQLVAFLNKWGAGVGSEKMEVRWFYGNDADGYVAKVTTSDFMLARRLYHLKDNPNFQLEIGEITPNLQKKMRLIQTVHDPTGVRSPLPAIQPALSEMQLRSIQKNYACTKKVGPEPAVSILGVPVPSTPTVPKPAQKAKEGWEVAKKGRGNKGASPVEKPAATSANSFNTLRSSDDDSMPEVDEEGDEVETDKAASEKQVETEKKEELKKSVRPINKELEKNNQLKKTFALQRKKLISYKLWGKETGTVLDTFCRPYHDIGEGLGPVIDALERIIKLDDRTAKKTAIEAAISPKVTRHQTAEPTTNTEPPVEVENTQHTEDTGDGDEEQIVESKVNIEVVSDATDVDMMAAHLPTMSQPGEAVDIIGSPPLVSAQEHPVQLPPEKGKGETSFLAKPSPKKNTGTLNDFFPPLK